MKKFMLYLGLGLCVLLLIFAEAFVHIQMWSLILKQDQPWVYIWGMVFVCVMAVFRKYKFTLDFKKKVGCK